MNLFSSNLFVFALALLPVAAGPCRGRTSTRWRPTLANPPEIRSHNGHLQATLEARNSVVTIGDRRVPAIVYNGSYVPPTLRLNRVIWPTCDW